MKETNNQFEKSLEIIIKKYLSKNQYKLEVERQWYPFRGAGRTLYSPISDIAIGPFAIEENMILQYNELEKNFSELLRKLEDAYHENYRLYMHFVDRNRCILPEFIGNENARCFIAFEIESLKTSRKHKMGSIVNAAALGRIGILVGKNNEAIKVLIKILEYLKFLASVGKPTFKTDNIFILSKRQVFDIFR